MTPWRRRLKASRHHNLFRWDPESSRLTVSLRPGVRVNVNLSSVANPLFRKYGEASNWRFGLTLNPVALLFHFRVPHSITIPPTQAGVDLNFHSADIATSDGVLTRVDLHPITQLQERMFRKRQSITRQVAKDFRQQRAVLRRYHRRETRRVTPLLHHAANELLEKVGERSLVFEDLTDATESIARR
ncbi:MAG: hypothetical protein L3K14_06785 [Thermoplasmata archaeon]|nr:hypothetical protein [Thermoplasmata archaeon]